MKFCKRCGKLLTSTQKNNIYCSQECANLAKSDKKIQQWLNGEWNGIRGSNQLSSTIREYLLKESNYSCEICGWNKINPVTHKSPLEIHHKDGNCMNNSKENLQVLCPNCHSLTENYKALNKNSDRERTTVRKNYCVDCGKEINQSSTRCVSCSNKSRIKIKPLSRTELKEKIRNMPFTKIAEENNVTDNAIRKWCIGYDLPSKKKDINSYSDEEWEKI